MLRRGDCPPLPPPGGDCLIHLLHRAEIGRKVAVLLVHLYGGIEGDLMPQVVPEERVLSCQYSRRLPTSVRRCPAEKASVRKC